MHWNTAETSWDCPCHGSRYDCDGQVLNGPAVAPLEGRAIPLTAAREAEEEAPDADLGGLPEPA